MFAFKSPKPNTVLPYARAALVPAGLWFAGEFREPRDSCQFAGSRSRLFLESKQP